MEGLEEGILIIKLKSGKISRSPSSSHFFHPPIHTYVSRNMVSFGSEQVRPVSIDGKRPRELFNADDLCPFINQPCWILTVSLYTFIR